MFKKMAAALGSGGAKVDTVLDSESVQPGGTLTGRVDIHGGKVEQTIQGVRAALSAVVEVETTNHEGEDTEYNQATLFNETRVSGPVQVEAERTTSLPFTLQVPVELPPNVIAGNQVKGIKLAVATVLEIEKARDAKDHDPIQVHALPAQEAVLLAFLQLGFSFTGGDLEKGRAKGATLGFYGEYEFAARGTGYRFNEVEVTFATRPGDLDVIIEVDKKGAFFGGDKQRSFALSHQHSDVGQAASHIKAILDDV